jgi:citronellol/citronellal dehydrogenase
LLARRPVEEEIGLLTMTALRGKTIVMSGGSRGIGLAIALRAARDGANVALLAKTSAPHPRLEGTIHTAAAEIEAAGGQALAIVGDVRDDDVVAGAVAQAAERFGGIDIVVNNASAIDVSPSSTIAMKRYDLMQDVNARGTFLLSRLCVPYLREADNPHVLTLSPPLSLDPKWYGPHLAYTLAKFGMSMCTLGMAVEHADAGIAFNSLWPRTIIATAAVQNLLGGDAAMAQSRKPEIVADAAHHILTRPARTTTGNFFIDDEVLADAGVTDLGAYAYVADADLQVDLFLDG